MFCRTTDLVTKARARRLSACGDSRSASGSRCFQSQYRCMQGISVRGVSGTMIFTGREGVSIQGKARIDIPSPSTQTTSHVPYARNSRHRGACSICHCFVGGDRGVRRKSRAQGRSGELRIVALPAEENDLLAGRYFKRVRENAIERDI